MEVIEKKVEPIAKIACCEKCKTQLEYKGFMLSSNPPLYTHKCPQCGEEMNLNNMYPLITYKFID